MKKSPNPHFMLVLAHFRAMASMNLLSVGTIGFPFIIKSRLELCGVAGDTAYLIWHCMNKTQLNWIRVGCSAVTKLPRSCLEVEGAWSWSSAHCLPLKEATPQLHIKTASPNPIMSQSRLELGCSFEVWPVTDHMKSDFCKPNPNHLQKSHLDRCVSGWTAPTQRNPIWALGTNSVDHQP